MKKKFVFIFLLMMAGVLSGHSDKRLPELTFRHINTQNGLPSNRVRDIVQDNEGFMWFATDGGVVRFDGTRHKIFVPSYIGNKEEIYAMNLALYGNGLLVGTDHGIFAYNPEQEKIYPLPLTYKEGIKGRLTGYVSSIVTDIDDTIWVAVESQGIFRITPEGLVSEQFLFPEVANNVSVLYLDNTNGLWGVSNTGNGVLYKYDRKNSKFTPFPLELERGKKQNVGGRALFNDENGDFWLGTWENGLINFNPRNGEAKRFVYEHPTPILHVHSINQYSPSLLLIGSDSGLLIFDTVTGEYESYISDETNPESINGRFVYPIVKDSEGGFWIGTFYRGLNYIGKDSGRFRKWYHTSTGNSISGNIISRICEDEEGVIWIGSADGGLCSYDPSSGSFRQYPLSVTQENDNVNALFADKDKLWVGTYSNGIGVLDKKTGKWRKIPVEGDNFTNCYAILIDSTGRVWMGATESLALYNPNKDCFEKISNLKSWISDIEEDENGELWISTQGGGLFRFNPESKKWKNYKATGQSGSLPHNHVNDIKIDSERNIYVGTQKGVVVYNQREDGFVDVVELPQGNAANAIEKSGEDLWISTNMGLVCISSDGKIKNFAMSDGLSDDQFLPGSSCLASDGRIYYGSVHGLSSINPHLFRKNDKSPKLVFTGLDIINNPVEVGDKHLPVAIDNIKKIELSPDDHTFTIYFSALSYTHPNQNRYRYKLEGFDKGWIDPGDEGKASYSNLPPGSYTFRLQGSDSNGQWDDEGISLKIVMKPAWYASALMKTLYILVVLAMLIIATMYILWRMEKSHMKELERISDNQEKEMFRSKLNFFTVVAHEIRTPVSLIIGPLEKVLSSGEKFSVSVKEDLRIIERNARRLLSLVNQLLDYKKVESSSIPLGFRHSKIIPQLESIIERFRPSIEHQGKKITEYFPDPDLTVDIDQESITKLVSNLINNAMKFTKDTIHVECKPLEDGKRFMISVSDNGIGISKENQDKVFKPFFQVLDDINEAKGGTGLGLSIVKSVVEVHGGEIILDSSPGKGATFKVILPMHQERIIPVPEDFTLPEEDIENQMMSPDETENKTEEDPVLLVVDDNEEMVNFISSHFEKNYEVLTASNGKEALEKMKERNVSLIICDWMMPVMDGEEFLREIRHDENYSHIPFVMLTAKTDNASKIESMKSGADAYVEKPFSISYLDARIGNLLEMRALLRKKYSNSPLEPITTIAQSDVDNELLRRLQNLIEENFSNPQLSVDFLADHLGISRSGLYAKIKTLADVTPNELIQITRLKKAAELLAENKYRINEICYMVGFNSSSYFSRCFQKQFGMKPGEFAAKK